MRTGPTATLTRTFVSRALGVGMTLVASAAWAASIDDLAWMSGCWVNGDEQRFSEEFWTPPRAGSMFGINRSRRGTGPVAFEFLRIEADHAGIRYVAQPGGGAATEFRLEAGKTARRAAFVNPEHDFPTRIEYWLDGDQLHAEVSGGSGSEPLSFAWRPCTTPDAQRSESPGKAAD